MRSDHWFARLSDAMRDHEGARIRTDLLPPRYEILGEPKAGGMGVVYRAWDRDLGREVAIKVLLEGPDGQARSVSRLRREAELAGRLTHPSIVAVHDLGTWKDSGQPYMVMQYIDGASLDQAGIRDLREVARILAKAARAAASAHEKGIVHRDLKPQNILLDRSGHVYLTDFGLAQDSRTAASDPGGEVAGTPAFMSPEQASGLPLDPRSDVYSLGATLYSLITGKPPARGATAEEILADVVRGIPAPVRKLRTDCPEALDRIVSRALAKRKEDRYPSAIEFAEALEGFRRRSLFGRHPWAFGAAAAVLLAGLVWMIRAREEHRRGAERAALAEIQELIGRDEFPRASARIAALREVLGEQDERLRSREEELRSRRGAAMERECEFLFDRLWAEDPKGARQAADRILRLDPEAGAARVGDVRAAKVHQKKLESEAETQLGAGEYREAEETVRKVAKAPFGALALRSIRPGLVERLKMQMGLPPKGPRDPEPIPGIRDALALLKHLAPQDGRRGDFEKALDLRDCYLKSQVPGADSRKLLELVIQAKAVDPNSIYTAELRKLQGSLHLQEEKLLDLAGRLQVWRSLGLTAFRKRAGPTLVGFRQQVAEAAETVPQPAAQRLLAEFDLAIPWLGRLDSIWNASPERPEAASGELSSLRSDALPDPWRAAAGELILEASERIQTGRSRLAFSRLSQSVDRGDAREAESALAELERLRGADLKEARDRFIALSAACRTLDEGRKLLLDGRVSEALRRFDQARSAMPRNPEITDLLVQGMERLGSGQDPQLFLEEYGWLTRREILEDPELRRRVNVFLDRVAGVLPEPAQAWNAALGPVNEALRAEPNRLDTRLVKSVLLRRLGDLAGAHEELSKVLEKEEMHTNALLLRGKIWFIERFYDKALQDFDKVLEAGRDHPSASYWRGMTFRRLNRIPEARKDLSDAIAKGFDAPDVYYELARCRYEASDGEDALASLRTAELREELLSDEGVISRNGEAVARREAIRLFRRDVRLLRADVLFRLRRPRECTQVCDEALALDPDLARAHFLKGWVAFLDQHLTEAQADLAKARKLYELAHDDFGLKETDLLYRQCLDRRGR